MAAIHLFTRSKTKSKISFSPVKKLVAATAVLATSYNIKILSQRLNRYHAYKHCYLRGIFDEKRLDEIF